MIQDDMTRREIRRLARAGKLMDTAFKLFQRHVFPHAAPAQVRDLRVTFMAGAAAELHALMTAGLDRTSPEDTSAEEEAMMLAVFGEIVRFHRRTVDFALQTPEGPKQ